jgi:anti-anti-sigma regulatory factor
MTSFDLVVADGAAVVVVDGELDHGSCNGLELILTRALAAGPAARTVLDLSRCRVLDEPAAFVVLHAAHDLRAADRGPLLLHGATGAVADRLELMGLTR